MAFSGGLTFEIGNGADPEVFLNVGEVKEVSDISISKGQSETSSFDSVNNKEYIAEYLADGAEITVTCNSVLLDARQQQMYDNVVNGANGNVRFSMTDGTTTDAYTFNVAYLGWSLTTSLTDAHTVSYTLKISGDITKVQS